MKSVVHPVESKYVETVPGISSLIYGYRENPNHFYVYLHGSGEFGKGRAGQYEYPGFATLLRDDLLSTKQPFVIACCTDGTHWRVSQLEAYIAELKELFQQEMFSLIGYSRGGSGVYSYLEKNSASSATIINSRLPGYTRLPSATPIHIIHSVEDQVTPVEEVEAFVANQPDQIEFTKWNGDHYSIEAIAKSMIWHHEV